MKRVTFLILSGVLATGTAFAQSQSQPGTQAGATAGSSTSADASGANGVQAGNSSSAGASAQHNESQAGAVAGGGNSASASKNGAQVNNSAVNSDVSEEFACVGGFVVDFDDERHAGSSGGREEEQAGRSRYRAHDASFEITGWNSTSEGHRACGAGDASTGAFEGPIGIRPWDRVRQGGPEERAGSSAERHDSGDRRGTEHGVGRKQCG